MAIRTYKVTLDSKNTIAPEPVFLRQGDKTGAVVIDATLMDNGTPVSLSGLTPMFKANTADGQAVIVDSTGFNIVNASGGEFTYQVPNALSAVPGKIMTAYFSFSDTSGTESTFDVAFIIKKAVDITKPQADDYITIIDGTLQSLQQKIDAMNTDVKTILDDFNQGNFYNKTQTDSKDSTTLASAKAYADTQDAATLESAKSYIDSGDTGWVKVALVNATGDVFIRKIGKHVMMRGSFKTTVSSSVSNQFGLVGSLPDEFKSTTDYSPIIELAGPWDPHYIIVQVACISGKIAQIGGTQNTTVFVESIRWEVD